MAYGAERGAEDGAQPSLAVRIELVGADTTAASLEWNGIPCLREAIVHAPRRIVGARLDVEVADDAASRRHHACPPVDADAAVGIDLTGYRLPIALLGEATERRPIELVATLVDAEGLALGTARHRIVVLPPTHWCGFESSGFDSSGFDSAGSESGGESLASFVTPNAPELAELLRDASKRLAAATGSGALDGYQSDSPERAQRIAAAAFEALAARDLTYVGGKPSFERSGQKVRTIAEVLADRLGNCLDLSVALAALFEACGLRVLLLVGDGHATVGFSTLDERFPDPIHRGPSRVLNRHELGQLRVVESTAVCAGGAFASALESGARWIAGASERIAIVDIAAARAAGFHPLPEIRAAVAAGGTAATIRPESRPWTVVQPAGLPPIAPSVRSPRERRLEQWKRKLLDLTLRNRLLNDRESAGVPLAVAGDDGLALLEDALWEGRALKLHPRLERGVVDADALRRELASGLLRTTLTDDQLFARATKAARDARTSLEESGARSLFVAVGFLEFRPPQRAQPVQAPLLLVPVALERISRSEGYRVVPVNEDAVANLALFEHFRQSEGIDLGVGGDLAVDERGLDVPAILARVRHAIRDAPGVTVRAAAKLGIYSFRKLPLYEAMRSEAQRLLAHPVVTTFLDRMANEAVRNARLVGPEDLRSELSFASARLPLPADSSQIAAVLSAARGATFVLQGPPGTGKSQTITNLLAECLARGKRVLFVAEKAAALEVVSDRLDKAGLGAFALDLHSDRATRSSFVEQIKRAREDVESRMPTERPGFAAALRDLDATVAAFDRSGAALHDPDAEREGRLAPFAAIERSLELAADGAPDLDAAIALPREGRLADLAQRLEAARALGAAAAALPAEAAAWLGRFDPPRALDASEVDGLLATASSGADAGERLLPEATALSEALGFAPPRSFAGLRSHAEFARLAAKLDPRLLPVLAAALAEDGDRAVADIAASVASIEAARAARRGVLAGYEESVLSVDLATLLGDLRAARERFILFRWSAARRTRAALARHAKVAPPKGFAALLRDVEAMHAARTTVADEAPARDRLRARLGEEPGEDLAVYADLAAATELGRAHRGRIPSTGRWRSAVRGSDVAARIAAIKPDVERAWMAAIAIDEALRPKSALAKEGTSLEALRDVRDELLRDARLIAPASAFAAARAEATRLGIAPLAVALLERRIAPGDAERAAERALLAGWLRERLAREPALADATQERSNALRELLAKRLEEYRAGVSTAVVRDARGRIRAELARLAESDAAATRVLNGLLAVSTIRRSIRRVMGEGSAPIAALKPIVLASPLSAATHLPPEFPPFDLVVFDEASQVPTHDAACALVRGASAVIVGDSRQLPPTSFFDRVGDADADAEEDLESLESVLDEAVAAGVPQRSLLWHYRSRDERLIDFSNRRSYGGRLKTFPSPFRSHPDLGVEFRFVEGTYDRGGTARNRVEAEAVVAELVRRLKDDAASPANRSIGVVTFSQAQQTLVEDLLDEASDADALLRERLAEAARLGEPVFVKNLENVQGDERATMLFSICYGRDADGRIAHAFGPLNLAGGERRLNVAVTRAREKVVVFSSIRAGDLDPARCSSRGAQDLRSYLAYAESGTIPAIAGGAAGAAEREPEPGAAERALARALGERGFRVDLLVGRSPDFRVSLAVARNDAPESWILGVALDGQFHRTAPTALDREVVRIGVLRGLRWRVQSVSTADVWRDLAGVADRIAAAAADNPKKNPDLR